jgi:divalent metal cation (Fe/Co/Zn/Cd) transporter
VLAAAEQAALSVPGVGHVHARGRWMGRSLIVEVEGFVAGATTIEQSEAVGRAVEAAVVTAVPEVRAVQWSPRAI